VSKKAFFAVLSLLLLSCRSIEPRFEGTIDEDFQTRVLHTLEHFDRIAVSSRGGSPEVAYEIAKEISRKQVEVVFPENCFSACSEILIPATPSPKFTPETLIGFHGSDLIAEQLYRRHFRGELPLCGVDRIAWLHLQYEERGLNSAFALETTRRIGVSDPDFIVRRSGCVGARVRLDADFWFPTSAQLLTYWGLDTGGPICSDLEECWRERLTSLNYQGRNVVVGDRFITL